MTEILFSEIPFSDEQLQEIPYETPEGWTEVSEEKLTEHYKYTSYYSRIISNGMDFFEVVWSVDDSEGVNYDEIEVHRVLPHTYTKTVTEYIRIK